MAETVRILGDACLPSDAGCRPTRRDRIRVVRADAGRPGHAASSDGTSDRATPDRDETARAFGFGMSEGSDADLLARVGKGDETAFRALIARKLDRVRSLAFRMLGDASLAEDVAQETFLRVWRTAADWRQGQARFDTWLHRVVLNLSHDRLRRRRVLFVAEPPEQADPAIGADLRLSQDQVSRKVRGALAALPRRQREAIVLQTWGELSNAEIAATMGIGVEAIESLLARGRRTLRKTLEGFDR